MSGVQQTRSNVFRPTQVQMFYREQCNIAGANEVFLELVKAGMTRQELQRNIERRPWLWGRFVGWLERLPSQEDAHE